MGSPKARPDSRTRRAAVRWARCCYRLLYMLMLVASVYAVLSYFRPSPSFSAREVAEQEPLTHTQTSLLQQLYNETVTVVPLSRTEREQLRWVDKPNSLCFGLGNVTILSVAVGLPQAYLVQLRTNRLSYAALHGYRYCEVSTSLDSSRPISWTKVKAMQLLLSFADIVVAMEADAIIRNKSITVESILSLHQYNVSGKDVIYTSHFMYSRDADPHPKAFINTGVYIMQSTPWTKAYLEIQYQFYRTALFQKNVEHHAVRLYCMKYLDKFTEHVAIIPFRYMNSPSSREYDKYEEGDFVVHYADEHCLEKYERLATLLASTNA